MIKSILGIVLAGVMLLSNTFAFAQTAVKVSDPEPIVFSDISKHWSNGAVQHLTKKGAIPFENGKFIPGKAITRSEFAIMLHKALDIQIAYFKAPDIKDYFDDVKQDATFTSALIDLVTAQIIDSKGSFNPEGTLSREEMVHYIMNAYKYKMGDVFAYIKIKGGFFADHNKIAPIYSGDVDYAAYSNLITGVGKNLFNPKSNSTRAEATVIISKLIALLEKQESGITIKPGVTVNEDSIEMKISIVNNSKESVIINHSSGQKFDFVLLDANNNVLYTWSADKSFIAMLTSTTIEAGKSIKFSAILDGEQYKAIKDKIVTLKAYVIGSSDSFSINTEGYKIR